MRLGEEGTVDEQQARLLESLKAAGSTPLSFDELRAVGIDSPAVVCYELQAAGIPITRVRDPRRERPAQAVVAALEPDNRGFRPRVEHPMRRWSALAAVAAAFALVSVTAALSGPSSRSPVRSAQTSATRRAGGRSGSGPAVTAAGARQPLAVTTPSTRSLQGVSRNSSATRSTGSTPSAGGDQARSSAVLASRLQASGHRFLGEGRYGAAIGELRAAVVASGQSVAACSRPGSEACFAYAYALYDLGRALRLGGDPAAAVPVLSQRLQIDNQSATVREELELATSQQAEHQATRTPPPPRRDGAQAPRHETGKAPHKRAGSGGGNAPPARLHGDTGGTAFAQPPQPGH